MVAFLDTLEACRGIAKELQFQQESKDQQQQRKAD
jgi:hypothetical protein